MYQRYNKNDIYYWYNAKIITIENGLKDSEFVLSYNVTANVWQIILLMEFVKFDLALEHINFTLHLEDYSSFCWILISVILGGEILM